MSTPEVPEVGAAPPGVPDACVEQVLKADRYAVTARVRLVDGRLAIWKRSVVVLPPGVRVGGAARLLATREADHLERLDGVPGIPALLGRPAPDSFLRAWVPGCDLRQAAEVPDRVFPELRDLLAGVHERGMAYADMAKEENVLIEAGDGAACDRPWLIDFQISVAEGTWLGALVPLLQRADRYHLARHVKRRRPDQLTDADRKSLEDGKGTLRRLHRVLLKKPYNLITRRLIRRWSGAGEGRRDDEPRGMRDVR